MKARRRIFISYRRNDTAYVATLVRDELEKKFGKDSVFLDVDSIFPGQDFVQKIEDSLARSDMVLALIGDYWKVAGKGGRPPLDEPADFVRQELERALQHKLPVVPVLTGKAAMPAANDLPPTLHQLLRYQAFELRAGKDFQIHLAQLVKTVKDVPLLRAEQYRGASFSLSRTQKSYLIFGVVLMVCVAYPLFIHDRLRMNHAVKVNETAKLRPAPGTQTMPGTVVVHPGQTATYIDRSFRKYLMIREGGTYLDYWRKVRTADGKDGWIYGAYLDDIKLERP